MSIMKNNNNKKYYNKREELKEKEQNNKNISSIIFGYSKNNKSRNMNEKWGICHVKSMDYNKKKINTELAWNDNNTFYDKTFNDNNNNNNNNNNMNNNCKINMSTLGNKLNWNYSHYQMKNNNYNKLKNIAFNPVKNNSGIVYKDILNKFNVKNMNI